MRNFGVRNFGVRNFGVRSFGKGSVPTADALRREDAIEARTRAEVDDSVAAAAHKCKETQFQEEEEYACRVLKDRAGKGVTRAWRSGAKSCTRACVRVRWRDKCRERWREKSPSKRVTCVCVCVCVLRIQSTVPKRDFKTRSLSCAILTGVPHPTLRSAPSFAPSARSPSEYPIASTALGDATQQLALPSASLAYASRTRVRAWARRRKRRKAYAATAHALPPSTSRRHMADGARTRGVTPKTTTPEKKRPGPRKSKNSVFIHQRRFKKPKQTRL